jgi:hypothetical protein
MKYFIAKIVFQICIANGKTNNQFDEQWRLVEASSMEHAFAKARSIGKQQEETFLNTKQQQVNWKFVDVAEVLTMGKLDDGMEITSNTLSIENAHDYINFVKQKAMLFQTDYAPIV